MVHNRIEIVLNGPADAEEVSILGRSLGRSWADAERMGRVLSGSECVITARSEGRLVGFATVAGDGGVMAYLQHMWIAADVQGRGVGSAMMERIKGFVKAQGYIGLGMFADKEAALFYQRLGAEASSELGYIGMIAPIKPA